MKSITKKYELIFCDATENNNKYWRGILYDDGTGGSEFGRVGYDAQTCDYASHSIVESKMRSKLKKGYTELKVIGNIVVPSVVSKNLGTIAKSQIIKKSNPILDDLINRLVKSNIHNITSSTQISYNSTSGLFMTPLGVVTPTAIDDARDILAEIVTFITDGKYNSKFDKIVSRYLRLIPQNIGMKFNTKLIFPDIAAAQAQNTILDSLESTYKAINTQTNNVIEEDVFKVDMDVLDDTTEINRIKNWFDSTNRPVHGYSNVKIVNCFKIKIHDNWNNFNEKLGNIIEVFHATGAPNVLSILKSGLRPTPPATTHINGALFGGGVYGALDSSKSLQYTMGKYGMTDSRGYCFCADVVLGNTHFIKTYGGNRASGYDSIWARAKDTGLRFDEIIVPNANQVRLKYLLEVK